MKKVGQSVLVGNPPVFRLSCLFGITLVAVLATARARADDDPKRAAIPTGSAEQKVVFGRGDRQHSLHVFTYKPVGYKKTEGKLLLVFHGIDRNAGDYRDAAIKLADRNGCLVVAPRFDPRNFRGELYVDGGLQTDDDNKAGTAEPKETWTWQYVPKLVAEVRRREGSPDLPYYLLGHSGGGQFLERLAGFLPTDARRIVVANPGTHLFVTAPKDFPYPYGFGNLPDKLSNEAALKRFLEQPLTIFLGTADTLTGPPLNVTKWANRQGAVRYERGQNAFNAAKRLAEENKWAFNWRLVKADGVGHDEKAMFAHPNCEIALFGKRSAPAKR